MNRFRVLVISAAFPPIKAPESAHALFLCEALAQSGVEVHLLTTQGTHADAGSEVGLTVHPQMRKWRWRNLPRLMWFLYLNKPDAILLIYIDWIYGCHPMITFLPTLTQWLGLNAVFVTQFENENGLSGSPTTPHFRVRLIKALVSRIVGLKHLHSSYGTLLRDSRRIIALSDRHLDAFERELPGVSDKATVIPAPPIMRLVSDECAGDARIRGRESLGAARDEFLLIYFGYLYPLKGVETLLRAFGGVVTHCPVSTRLIVVGGALDAAYADSLRRLADECQVAKRVIWTGFCEPENEAASLYLHASDLCVLPFEAGVRLNNSSFAVAATHGLPIVTTRGENLEPAFVDGENVCLCPPRDPLALADTLARLICDGSRRERLRAGARRLAQEHFSWDGVVAATLRMLGAPLPKDSLAR